MRFGADGPIKVGRANNPRVRRASLSMPVEPILLGAMESEDAKREEAALHERLAAHRVRGEWFGAEAVLALMSTLEDRLVMPEQIRGFDNGCSAHMNIRCFEEELAAWKAAAAQAGKTFSSWIRERCESGLPLEERNRERT